MSDAENSSFDKNLRSLLEAISMFEREAGLVLDRIGLDTDAIGRVMDMLGSLSSEAVRPIAAALGIADAGAVEALSRDVRALLQGEARLRREQAQAAARFGDVLTAVEALGATTARLADLQSRTHERLDALAERAAGLEDTGEQRQRLSEELAALRTRIDSMESRMAAELAGSPLDGSLSECDDPAAPAGIRAGARRMTPRTVKASSGTHKILEGLPTIEPKSRPA